MYTRILQRMREKVRLRHYVMTLHADEEMDDDDLTIFDVESAILTGAIIARQKDRKTVRPKNANTLYAAKQSMAQKSLWS